MAKKEEEMQQFRDSFKAKQQEMDDMYNFEKLKQESGIDLGALDMNALIKQKDEDVLRI